MRAKIQIERLTLDHSVDGADPFVCCPFALCHELVLGRLSHQLKVRILNTGDNM